MIRRTPTTAPRNAAAQAGRYRDRIFDDQRHDPYQTKGKFAGPLRCSGCGAVYLGGRWQRLSAPEGSDTALCPACRRIHDKLPAGQVVLDGPFVAVHREELLRIARNEALREESEHPLHRIMQVDEHVDSIVIATTDIHLPQRIGEAVRRACRGELDVRYGSDEYSVRVHWQR